MVSIVRPAIPTAAANPQLDGLLRTAPMPTVPARAISDGTSATYNPATSSFTFGGLPNGVFSITPAADTTPGITIGGGAAPGLTMNPATPIVGGGGTPANGAQPAAPGAAATGTAAANGATNGVTHVSRPAAGAGTATGTTAASMASGPAATATATGGFGRKERTMPMVAHVGDATFSFPSFNASAKSLAAPGVKWGPGWTQVKQGDQWYMQHTNGAKAVPALEYRITPTPLDGATPLKVANGWGKKFPDGTVLIFDRTEGPYKLAPDGTKSAIKPGMHTFGGVKVRLFEASVVRVLEKSGAVTVFDSRGNVGAGTPRTSQGAALAAAGGGADMVSAPGKGGGPEGKGGGPLGKGSLVGGGETPMSDDDLQTAIGGITNVARGLLAELQSGGAIDPTRLQELQAQIATLPAGLLQAAGAGTMMTGDGTTIGLPGRPGTDDTTVGGARGEGDAQANGTMSTGGGASTPNSGAQANAVTTLSAGTKKAMKLDVPANMEGKSYRFAQLPMELQEQIAKGLGSSQGSKALEADTLVVLSATGVTFPEGGPMHLRHQAQVTGGGPGEDLAFTTMRPVRQPSPDGVRTGGGGNTIANDPVRPNGGGGGGTTVANTTHKPKPATTGKPVFSPGGHISAPAANGVNGAFTWATMPAKVRNAVIAFLFAHPERAGAQVAMHMPQGWGYDAGAKVVVSGGDISFPDGLTARPLTTTGGGGATTLPPVPGGTSRPPASGGTGATTQPIGHDATRPPVTGGGGTGTSPLRPGTPPPVPAGADMQHQGMPGM